MGASMMAQRPGGLDLNSLNSNLQAIPIPGINSTREAQYVRRIKELEEEFRVLRSDNEKNVGFFTHLAITPSTEFAC